ncbi:MAG: TIGR01212 family radical SAM protein [Bacteroidales bacterium]|nr:TIGR01212 family radical SAM protein [Bacteroidales bacterium]
MKYNYNNYSQNLIRKFGNRLQKLTINAGFSCPNRDGTIGVGGCTFCSNDAFNPSYCMPEKSIKQQIEEGKIFHQNRYKRAPKFLAYFQAFSNTYAPLETLKILYEEALSEPDVVGLAIGTRCDCLDDEKLKYIAELSKKYYVVLEIGVQSCYNDTLKLINRGHTFEDAEFWIKKAADLGIKVGIHIVFGLPDDTCEKMLAQVHKINELPIYSVKFHQLQIMKNTKMEQQFLEKDPNFNPLFFELDEYLDFAVDFVEQLRPDIIIERIAGEAPPRYQAKPVWKAGRNDQIMVLFQKRLEERGTFQGRIFERTSV